MQTKFPLGQAVITPGAFDQLPIEEVFAALCRHQQGDWGELDEEDRNENELALREGFRLLSQYQTKNRITFWIITEADRSVTTILLPSEY